MAGVTPLGIEIKRLPEILENFKTSFKHYFGDDIRTDPNSVFGLFSKVPAEIEAIIWEEIENAYNSRNLKSAEGVSLDNIALILGRDRLRSTQSYATLTLYGIDGTLVPKDNRFEDDLGEVWIQDETVQITSGQADVIVRCLTFGDIRAAAGSINKILDSVVGLNSVSNALDAIPGREAETDAELRNRLYKSVRGTGRGTYDTLTDSLIEIDDVTYARIIDNPTDTADAYGTPPHGFTAVTEGGEEEEIAEKIWQNKPAGIATGGSTSVIVKDSAGYDHTINFEKATLVDIYLEVDITVLAGTVNTDEMKTNIVTYANENFNVGDDIIISELYTPINLTPDITVVEIRAQRDVAPAPGDTTDIAISSLERGVITESRITITFI